MDVRPHRLRTVGGPLRFTQEHRAAAHFIHASSYASFLPAHAGAIAAAKAPKIEAILAWLRPHVQAGRVVDLPGPLTEMPQITRSGGCFDRLRRPSRSSDRHLTVILDVASWHSASGTDSRWHASSTWRRHLSNRRGIPPEAGTGSAGRRRPRVLQGLRCQGARGRVPVHPRPRQAWRLPAWLR